MGDDARLNVTIQLLGRYRTGDQRAASDLYQRYFDRLHAVVRLRMGSHLRGRMESMDVVQDAFMASLRDIDRFEARSEGDFFHWLCHITENRIRDQADFVGRKKRDAGRDVALAAQRPSSSSLFGPIAELARTTTPSMEAVRAEDLKRLEEAMEQLQEQQREAILLVRYEGLSLAEAGEKMGRTADAVRMLLARAIVALGKAMGGATGPT